MERKIETKRFRWLAATLLLVAAMVMPSTAWAQSTYTDDFVGGRTDFRDESIYFVLTTRFYDGDKTNNAYCWDHSTAGNGMDAEWRGDFKGLIEKLDYIKALGFTAVWISPVAENASGYDYHGYHPIDFSKEDLRLQSKANAMLGIAQDVTFQTLVDEAHKRGMKIILDIVLNSTCNFGEANLCQMFRRDYNVVFEGDYYASMTPITVNDTDEKGNPGKLAVDYLSLTPGEQYQSRLTIMKNSDGENHDSHNYWHHESSMSFGNILEEIGMIAGDCVDLNTENPAVYKYLRESYGRFIEMGVDGFRIDCAKHISRLTFNKAFLPYFRDLGEQYKSKRLNECPFFIYGEVASRCTSVTNYDGIASTPYYYTWQSDASLLSQWSDDATFWDDKEILGNTDVTGMGNIGLTNKEYITAGSESDQPKSDNALLNGNDYHAPDVSQASGMNVIDFPMHWNFGRASDAFGIAKSGDRLYNDATYNVVYVDSHDYAPDYPSQQTRFSGGTVAWAENLDLMFTFRGIPCLYYGSEIEFKKGCVIDVGPNAPLKNTGRAYYGGYITGDVTATGFGSYSDASGNLATTLSKPLARHIARLSQIRQKIPALRKGQYSIEGCNGTIAFKRRYTNGDIDSYALVAISGAANFTNVLNGEYTEVITGQTVTVNDGTLTSPEIAKGNMRIYVLNGTGKIGMDGPYLFDNTAATATELTYNGHEEDDCEEAPEDCRLKFSPEASTFNSETLEVNITPSNKVVSAWYKIGEYGEKTDITGETTITIGEGVESGDIDIYYGCTNDLGIERTGKVTYHKTVITDGITIYVKGDEAPYIYAGDQDWTPILGLWPGTKMTKTTTINGEQFWYYTITGYDSFNYVLNYGNSDMSNNHTADGDRYHDESWKDITDEITTAPTRLTLTVAGEEALLGAMWDPQNTECDMTTKDGKTYTLTLLNRTLAAGDYQYKVCQDHGWETTYPNNENAVVTIPMDGKYDITFTYNVGDDSPTATIKPSEGETFVIYYAQLLSPQGVTTDLTTKRSEDGIWTSELALNEGGEYTITVTGSDNSSYQYKFTPEAGLPYQMNFNEKTNEISVSVRTLTLTVAGDEALLGAGWNPANTECDMTSQDGKLYTLTLLNRTLAAGNYNFKVYKDHSWDTTYPAGGNAVVTIPMDGKYDITFTYNVGDNSPTATIKPSEGETFVIYNAQLLSPQGVTTDLTTKRNEDGIWTSELALNEDGEYTIAVTGSDNSSYQYKFTPEAGLPYQMNFNEKTNEISVSVRTLTLTVAGEDALLGAGWNPANTECDMTSQDGKTYTLTLLNRTLAVGDYYYRVYQDHGWAITYPDPNGIAAFLNIPEDGTYDITFSYKYGDAEPTAVATKSGISTGVDSIGMTDIDSKHNVIFDLQGRKVGKPAKELYIMNGKKLFVR